MTTPSNKGKPIRIMKVSDITYIPDYRSHVCKGKPEYALISATVVNGKRQKVMDLVRCKTCGKVFSEQTTSIKRGTKIYCHRKNRHTCTGEPRYIDINASLFDGKFVTTLNYCKTCGKYFYASGKMGKMLDLNKAHNWYYDLYAQDGRVEKPEEEKKKDKSGDEVKKPVAKPLPPEIKISNVISAQDFLVVTSVKRCALKGHELMDVDARVRVITKQGLIRELIIPAIFCKACKQYYLLDQDYETVLRYGTPICRTITVESYIKMKEGKLQYNEESLLHSLGYNVNAQEDLPDSERQRILGVVIDENVMKKSEVLSFLDYLIRRSIGSPRLDNARDKWTRDRQFVSQYKRQPGRKVDVESITIRRYKAK